MKLLLATAALLFFSTAASAQSTSSFVPLYGLHAGSPQKLSVTLGLGWMPNSADSGPFVSLEPGLAGTRLALGWTRLAGHGGAYGARASLLRTYSDPWGADSNATYAGVEGHVMVLIFTLRAGGACRTTEGAGGRCIVTSSFGLLF